MTTNYPKVFALDGHPLASNSDPGSARRCERRDTALRLISPTVDLRGAPIWKCSIAELGLNMQAHAAQKAWSSVWNLLNWEQEHQATDLRADDLFRPYTGSPLIQRISKPVTGLVTATDGFDVQSALHAATQVIGLGSGVTPSGDDILIGFLSRFVEHDWAERTTTRVHPFLWSRIDPTRPSDQRDQPHPPLPRHTGTILQQSLTSRRSHCNRERCGSRRSDRHARRTFIRHGCGDRAVDWAVCLESRICPHPSPLPQGEGVKEVI